MNVKNMDSLDNNDIINNKKINNEDHNNIEERKNIWLKGINMCEWCGRNRATINLELKYGSHRECRHCWDRC